MNFSAVFNLLGRLAVLLGSVQLLPIAWCLWFDETSVLSAFVWSAGIAVAVGLALAAIPNRDPTLYRREGILIVVLGWGMGSVIGALPYLFSGVLVGPVDALFESASGFTTTGASVLLDIPGAGYGILFWRSLTQWLGGLGIVVVFLALLSGQSSNARVLYRFEVPGPTTEVLHARVHETASALFKLYVMLTVAETVLLKLAGLSFFEALTHSLSTVSTGGFSPRADSAAGLAPLAQIIIIVFMVIGGVNFSLIYGLRFKRFRWWQDREFSAYVVMLGAAALLIAILLVDSQGVPPLKALLDSVFQTASLMTTTGFSSVDFDGWPAGARGILLLVMMVGGCAGSTAGGIKVSRIYLAFKTVLREVKLSFKPEAVIPVSMRGRVIAESVVGSTTAFLLLFFVFLITGTLLLAGGGTDLVTASTAALATLGNVGPGLGGVGPEQNYAAFSSFDKLVLVGLMLLGRLEILAIASLLTRSFWRR